MEVIQKDIKQPEKNQKGIKHKDFKLLEINKIRNDSEGDQTLKNQTNRDKI